ncbi:LysR family transcriptional regulator [Leisingera sp. ANG-Vp]|uniref:LysR family transcriptional regulator n=1 Tax=Leisingera sp. ANG-Vp TaxID=1577896 RepID=UPI00057CC680|nr:LysR family transcriptional regulator [Leisingera sp. ANG-Vp]KIC13976.1 LysR family transcriptional regulator [Leisingera sp. ANG-Vp]
MTVTLKAMRYFTTALQHGSISRAAEELHVAASAVSAAIDQIETQFQLQLITRHRARGIEPTRAGRDMARKFTRLLEDYDSILAEGAELKQEFTGSFRLGYYAPVAPGFLPQILTPFLAPRHQVALELEECHNDAAQAGLQDGRYDAILFVPDGSHPQIDYDVLLQAPPYALLHPGHPLAANEVLSLADLANEPLIALNRPMVTDYQLRLFAGLTRRPETIVQANTTEMVRAMVAAGHGCAILNMRPATDLSYGGQPLAARPIADGGTPLSLAVGYNRTNPRRITSAFAKACKDWAASPAAAEFIVLPPNETGAP